MFQFEQAPKLLRRLKSQKKWAIGNMQQAIGSGQQAESTTPAATWYCYIQPSECCRCG
jgi:hypothetical protein